MAIIGVFPSSLLGSANDHRLHTLSQRLSGRQFPLPLTQKCMNLSLWYAFFLQWVNKKDDEKILAVEWKLVKEINKAAKTKNQAVGYGVSIHKLLLQGSRSNIRNREISQRKLQTVSKKYDSKGFFQNSALGGFKLQLS